MSIDGATRRPARKSARRAHPRADGDHAAGSPSFVIEESQLRAIGEMFLEAVDAVQSAVPA